MYGNNIIDPTTPSDYDKFLIHRKCEIIEFIISNVLNAYQLKKISMDYFREVITLCFLVEVIILH